jgi:ribosome-binding protein aMBF1 (putative translation factor)
MSILTKNSRGKHFRTKSKTCKVRKTRSIRCAKEMSLSELRQIKNLSQHNLAASMNKKQSNLSKMERNSDMYVSTLRMFIEAMGGSLEIIAQFPDEEVRINQFRG